MSEKRLSEDQTHLVFHTNRGDLTAYAHTRRGLRQGVILLGGDTAGNGLDSAFPQFADDLLKHDIASLRLDYRIPGDCVQCAIDALLGCQYLDDEGVGEIQLVGWSFGGAVAMAAGSVARSVVGVVAISARFVSDCCARRLTSKPLLLIHGEEDTVSPVEEAKRIYLKSAGPRKLVVYPGTGHDFKESRDELQRNLIDWMIGTFRICRETQEPVSAYFASE